MKLNECPDEIFSSILYYLDREERFPIRSVSKSFYKAVNKFGVELKVTESKGTKQLKKLKNKITDITVLTLENVKEFPSELFETIGFSRVDNIQLYGNCSFYNSKTSYIECLPKNDRITNLSLFRTELYFETINWLKTHYGQLKKLEIINPTIESLYHELFEIPFDLEEFKIIGFPTQIPLSIFSRMKNLTSVRINIVDSTFFESFLECISEYNVTQLEFDFECRKSSEILETIPQTYSTVFRKLTKLSLRVDRVFMEGTMNFKKLTQNGLLDNIRDLTLNLQSDYEDISNLNLAKLDITLYARNNNLVISNDSLRELIIRNEFYANNFIVHNFPKLVKLHIQPVVSSDEGIHKLAKIIQTSTIDKLIWEDCMLKNVEPFKQYSKLSIIKKEPFVPRADSDQNCCQSYQLLRCCCMLAFVSHMWSFPEDD